MSKIKKRASKKPAPSSNHTEEQARALKALELAAQAAKDLIPFKTPEGILTDETAGDHDDVLQAIEEIAEKCYEGGLDFEEAVSERFPDLARTDTRAGDLYSLHIDELHAGQMAAFALGVAWGRLQGGAR